MQPYTMPFGYRHDVKAHFATIIYFIHIVAAKAYITLSETKTGL